ncbi:MAG: TolC family protein [Gammaproteobacteria bacterium]
MNRQLLLYASVLMAGLVSGCALTPQALREDEVKAQAANDYINLTKEREPVRGPISMYEALARALKYNLDFRLELTKKVLALEQLNVSRYEMLPQFVSNLSYNARDKFSGASSRSLITGRQSLESSTSSDRDVGEVELGLVWNVLDFGVSYYRAKQAADRVLIAEEQKRKAVNRIAQDVRAAYWRAVSAERLKGQLDALMRRVAQALSDSREVVWKRLDAPMTQLTYQRELLAIKRELQELQRDLELAKYQLAALMNLQPNARYELVVPERGELARAIKLSYAEMEQLALESRPELRELGYEKRINAQEARAAILELLPGLDLSVTKNYNSNSFLFHNNWVDLGSRVAWNLLNLIRMPQKMKELKAQAGVLDAQRLALSIAVLTQVNVSLAQYGHAQNEYQTASEYHAIQQGIIRQVHAGVKVNRIGEQALIREEMNTLVAELRYDIAYADLENSYAGVYAAVGRNPLPARVSAEQSVSELTVALKAHWEAL